MLGIVSMAGNALKAFGNTHPAVRWGVIVLAFLLAAEFVANEGLDLYAKMATTAVRVRVENSPNISVNGTRTQPDLLVGWNSLSDANKAEGRRQCATHGLNADDDAGLVTCVSKLARVAAGLRKFAALSSDEQASERATCAAHNLKTDDEFGQGECGAAYSAFYKEDYEKEMRAKGAEIAKHWRSVGPSE
jgi:hypothetical protein